MRLINLFLILSIILLAGCSYIEQFRESPMGEEEPFISIVPEEEIIKEEEVLEPLEIIEEEETLEEIQEEIKEEIESTSLTRLEVDEGKLVKLKLSATDADGDPLTYEFSEPLDENGEWQTKEGDAGEYIVKIMVDDGKTSTEKEILIVVKALNQLPVLKLESEITVDEGQVITLDPEVSDPDGDSVIITYSGWMTKESYKTTYDDSGVHTVTVTAFDGKETVTQNVKIIVNDINRAPVIESITLE